MLLATSPSSRARNCCNSANAALIATGVLHAQALAPCCLKFSPNLQLSFCLSLLRFAECFGGS